MRTGSGAWAISADRTRFHRFGEQQVGFLGTLDDRVFLDAIGCTHAVRLPTGLTVRCSRDVPHVLVGTMRRY